MNSLTDPAIAAVLDSLHRKARGDTFVFLRALPAVVWGAFQGRSVVESAKPYLKDAYIPIDRAQGQALYQFARARGARRVVEFGASFGISTIYLAAAVRDNGGGSVVTTEMEPKKIIRARENYARAGLQREIELLEGDALETLRSVDGPIDLVFLDGWKDACLPVLQLLETKLSAGACIFCDDIKGFRKTLKPYVDHVRANPARYASVELPLGDGLEFSVVL
ncbi:MAG: methyltransferase [Alphaproteobacteria bacterium]|nr:methyltransferase [Alphaproteobacteria bacterium]